MNSLLELAMLLPLDRVAFCRSSECLTLFMKHEPNQCEGNEMATNSATYVFTHRAVLEKAPKASGLYSIFNSKRWVHVGASDDIQQSLFRLLNKPNACLQRFSQLSFSFAPVHPVERAAHLKVMLAARKPACLSSSTNSGTH